MINAANVQHGVLVFGQVGRKLETARYSTVATMLDQGAAIWSKEGWPAMEAALAVDAAAMRGASPAASAARIKAHAKQSVEQLTRLQEGRPGSFPRPAGTSGIDDAAAGARSSSAAPRSSTSKASSPRPGAAAGGARTASNEADDLARGAGVTPEWAATFVAASTSNGWRGAPADMVKLHRSFAMQPVDAWRATVRMHESGFSRSFLDDVGRLSTEAPGQEAWALSFATNIAENGWSGAVDDLLRARAEGFSLPGAHRLAHGRWSGGLGSGVIDDAIRLNNRTSGGESWAISFATSSRQQGWSGAADDVIRLHDSGLPTLAAWNATVHRHTLGLGRAYLDDVAALARRAHLTPDSAVETARTMHQAGWTRGPERLVDLVELGVPLTDSWSLTNAAYRSGFAASMLDDVRTLRSSGFTANYAARAAEHFGVHSQVGGATDAARLVNRGFTPDYAVKVVSWAHTSHGGGSSLLAEVLRHSRAGLSPDDAVRVAAARM